MEPLLLVITPTLGSSMHLDETVATVSALPIRHKHVLVAPHKAIQRLGSYSQRCELLCESEGTKGMYAAINSALEESGVDWTHFTYVNDDDVLYANRVKHWNAALGSDPRVPQIWYGSVDLIDERSRLLGRYGVSKLPGLNPYLWRSGKVPCTQHGMVISRAAYERCGGFDASLRYVGDMAYILKLQRLGCLFHYTGASMAAFRVRRGQLSANTAAMEDETRRVRREYGLPYPVSHLHKALGLALLLSMNPLVYLNHVRRNGWISRDQLLHAA